MARRTPSLIDCSGSFEGERQGAYPLSIGAGDPRKLDLVDFFEGQYGISTGKFDLYPVAVTL